MRAAVYHGPNSIALESIPVPPISDGELLVRVHSCGVCGTDLKKIEHGLAPPPRVFGHEFAGTVARAGSRVREFAVGDRVAVHHHVPCRNCFYCARKLFSQCEFYRRTGTTAGFEPAGGGFAEYVRVMDWIVADGVVRVPDDVSFEAASFLEPLNTCLKALETAALESGELVVILGQGPIGLLMLQAALCAGARAIGIDPMPRRRELSLRFGSRMSLNPGNGNLQSAIAGVSEGRGADLAIVATAAPQAVAAAQELVRRGGRVLLFAHTVPGEKITVDASQVCVEEKKLIGSYSASVELQAKAAQLIFERRIHVTELVSHRFPLERLPEGVHLASHPSQDSLKIIIQP
jgi:L-iditol 2-dehydrogenase